MSTRGISVAAAVVLVLVLIVMMVIPVLFPGTAPVRSASITGTVRYEGEIPSLKPIDMDAEPSCASRHETPPKSELLVLGQHSAIANVFVRVKSGLPDEDYPVPAEPVVLDQVGCRYVPHVFGVMRGQDVKILNSDGIMHNPHSRSKLNPELNIAMPANVAEATHRFSEPEWMFKIKCDVHSWMFAYVAVLTHPYFDTTGTDGKYLIPDLPAGTYEIEVWHEKLGTKTARVTLAGGESKSVDFTMGPYTR